MIITAWYCKLNFVCKVNWVCLKLRKLMRSSCFRGMKPHVMQTYSSSIGLYLVIIRHRPLHLMCVTINSGLNNTPCSIYIIFCSLTLSNIKFQSRIENKSLFAKWFHPLFLRLSYYIFIDVTIGLVKFSVEG